MWSAAGALLIWLALCAAVVYVALRRLRAQLDPTRRSFDRLRDDLAPALRETSREAGRAEASRRLLLRHRNAAAPR